jgi:glycosyltransferase involved in cell wall biosynthesis
MEHKISVVIITLNEEIIECLSRLSFADEIIVVDSGSQDNWLQYVRNWGSSFLQ